MNWSRFIVLFVSLLWLFNGQLWACGPSEWISKTNAHYRLLHPDKFYGGEVKWDSLINAKHNAPDNNGIVVNFMGLSAYTDYDIMYDWTRYVNNPNIHTEGIASVVIPLTLNHWLAIDSFVRGLPIKLDTALLNNNFTMWLKTSGRKDITKLMVYLKKIERDVDYDWEYYQYLQRQGYYNSKDWRDIKRDKLCVLLDEGKLLYKQEPDKFLKMRYANQLVRLANYIGDNSEAIALYKATFEDLPGNHAIEQWMTMHYAGALSLNGYQPLANYYYIKVMSSGSEKAEIAFSSIRIRTQKDWDKTIALCTTDEEKSWLNYSFYQANRWVNAADRLLILKRILDNDPNSDYAKAVAIQFINQLETEVLPERNLVKSSLNYYVGEYSEETEKQRKFDKAKAMRNFHSISEHAMARMNNAFKPFWQMANGYVYFIEGNTEASKIWLSKVGDQKKGDKKSAAFASLFLKYIAYNQIGHIDAAKEKKLAEDMKWIEANFDKQCADFAYDILAKQYTKQNEHYKALLLSCKDVCYNMDKWSLDINLPFMQLVALREKKNKTAFEKWLLIGSIAPTNDELKEYHLMGLLSNYKFKEAAKHSCTFRSPNGKQYMFPNPFKLYTTNAIYVMSGWETYRPQNQQYSRHTFAWEMGELMDSIAQYPKDNGKYYLKLATGMAHMQKNGGAWLATSFYKSDAEEWYPSTSKAYKGSNQIASTFNKAYAKLKTKEEKAQALYGLIWYLDIGSEDQDYAKIEKMKSALIEKLYDNYGDTRYYQDILKECAFVYWGPGK